MGPKASASQRKLRRENSVCKVTKTHSLQQSYPHHPLCSLFSYWQQISRFGRVLIATRVGKLNGPHILVLNPTVPTVTSVDSSCSHTSPGTHNQHHGAGNKARNPQPDPAQLLYCCPGRRDFTQAATLCIPKKWQKQSNIRNTAKWSFGQTCPQDQLPPGGFEVQELCTLPLQPSLHWKQGYLQEHDESASIHAWHMPGVLIHGKRMGESGVWVWRQPGLEQLLCARIFVCHGFTKWSIQTPRTVTPLRAETHWEKDSLSQVTLPETSDTV